jgi:very-short-patch-repair endonuclease
MLAASQHGVVSRAQLHELGLSDSLIKERTRRTLWPLAKDIYAVGHPGLSRRGVGQAALLWAGAEAGLSCDTSARVWEMVARSTDGPVHVSTPNRQAPRLKPPAGVQLHRPTNLRPADIVVHRGVRVTTPERTLIDLLPSSSVAEITRMLEQTVTALGRSPDDLHAWGHALSRAPGRPKLLRALDEIAGPAVIRSEFESRFRTLCQEAGLPPAHTNYRLGRWELDAAWLDQRVAVELDSWRWHGGRWQFHRDRRKGLDISRAGFELIRLSWPQLKYDQTDVIEALRYALARGEGRAHSLGLAI